jgi:hypothetical protein
MNRPAQITEEQIENDGMIAIQTIENLLQEIIRRHAYPAERARQAMLHFAKGYCDYAFPSERSMAVFHKIFAMAKHLLRTTCLSATEIDDLIMMVAF